MTGDLLHSGPIYLPCAHSREQKPDAARANENVVCETR